MTEAEENLLRNLLAKMREEDRFAFCELVLDVFFVVQESSTFMTFEHRDDDGHLHASAVLVRGDDSQDLLDITKSYFTRGPVIDEDEDEDDFDTDPFNGDCP